MGGKGSRLEHLELIDAYNRYQTSAFDKAKAITSVKYAVSLYIPIFSFATFVCMLLGNRRIILECVPPGLKNGSSSAREVSERVSWGSARKRLFSSGLGTVEGTGVCVSASDLV